MAELLVDFVSTLDGYGAGEGWPGWWGLEGPEYLAWLDQLPDRDHTVLMGGTTYREMAALVAGAAGGAGAEAEAMAQIAAWPKVVFSSTLAEPPALGHTRVVRTDAVAEVRAMKAAGTSMRTLGSVSLCRSLLAAGLVDRFRVAVFPVITGRTGAGRIYDGYPDVALRLLASRTFDGRTQVLEYAPTVLDGP